MWEVRLRQTASTTQHAAPPTPLKHGEEAAAALALLPKGKMAADRCWRHPRHPRWRFELRRSPAFAPPPPAFVPPPPSCAPPPLSFAAFAAFAS